MRTKFKVRRYVNIHIVAIAVLGWGFDLRTPNLGEGEAVGVGDGTVRRSVCDFL